MHKYLRNKGMPKCVHGIEIQDWFCGLERCTNPFENKRGAYFFILGVLLYCPIFGLATKAEHLVPTRVIDRLDV